MSQFVSFSGSQSKVSQQSATDLENQIELLIEQL